MAGDGGGGGGGGSWRPSSLRQLRVGAVGAGDRQERALALAYRYLNRRDRTVSEMQRHLQARGCGVEETEAAIESLAEHGYLDDVRYARLFAEDKRDLEQWGSERIQRMLLERGIDRDLVEQASRLRRPRGRNQSGGARCCSAASHCRPVIARERERALGVLLRKGYETRGGTRRFGERMPIAQIRPRY